MQPLTETASVVMRTLRSYMRVSGWTTALRRYNGRRDRTDTDRYYSDEYADKIMRRANNPEKFEPIEIKLAAKTEKR